MTVFNTSDEFHSHGMDHLKPNEYRISQDCDICLKPLALVKETSSDDISYHAAVRIKSCRHMHGAECLAAWLKVGNSCPTCDRMLYLPAAEQSLTQENVDMMIRDLGGLYDEEDIARSLARYMHVSDAAAAKLKQIIDMKVSMEEARRKEEEGKEQKGFMLGDQDFLDSDSDTEWYEDEDEDEDEEQVDVEDDNEEDVDDDAEDEDEKIEMV